VLIFFFVCLLFLTANSGASGETLNPAAGAFMQWSSASIERLADSRVKLILALESSSPGVLLGNPVVFYRLTRLEHFNETTAPEGAGIHSLSWERSTAGLKIVIFSGEYGRASIFARVEIGGRLHYAQTAFNLYGGSGAGAFPEPNRLPQAPDWPEFLVSSDGPLYWPQTGQEFTLKIERSGGTSAKNLAVWDNGRQVAEVKPGAAGFRYRPEHDPILDRAGDLASKPLVFVVHSGDGDSVAFTLFVHRSRRAGWNLSAGLWVFAAGALVSGMLAWLTRRKFGICA